MKILLVVLFVSLTSMQVSLSWLRENKSPRNFVYVPPPQYIKYLHFGYSEVMADTLWIRAIQDFDYCGKPENNLIKPEEQILAKQAFENKADLDNELSHLMKEISTLNKDVNVCKNSWLAKMLDAVTELAPKFKVAYVAGATSLSVVLNDFEGASLIFNKGIKAFPNDWRLPYHAAYHFMYDRQDLARAAELLEIAAKIGAPLWVNSLAARAYTASGQGELAVRTLMAFREYTKGDLRTQVDERIKKIKQALIQEQQSPKSK